jgi:hypothetical protein
VAPTNSAGNMVYIPIGMSFTWDMTAATYVHTKASSGTIAREIVVKFKHPKAIR